MRIFQVLTGVLAAIAIVAGRAGAQAWVQPRDGYYFKVFASYLRTEEEFDFRGRRQDIFAQDTTRTDTSFRDVSFTAYLEYGVTERLTIVGSVPFKILTAMERESLAGLPARDNTRTNGGLGDLSLAVRTPIVQGPSALAVQGGVKIPLGYEKKPDNGGPPLGTGEVDFEIQVAGGRSLYPVPAYVSGGAGYRRRSGSAHDEIIYNVEAGYTAGQVSMKLRFDGLQSTVAPPDIGAAQASTALGGVNIVIVGDQDIFKVSPGVVITLNDSAALSADLFHTLAGKDTVTGTTFSLGLVFRR
jgi:hypothetical protein